MGRTRQVTTYGRRGRNFVRSTDKDFIPSPTKKSQATLLVEISSRPSPAHLRVSSLRASENEPQSIGSPLRRVNTGSEKGKRVPSERSDLPTITQIKTKSTMVEQPLTPSRRPLATKLNGTSSLGISPITKPSKTKRNPRAKHPSAPQTVEIIVIDESGAEASREERKRTVIQKNIINQIPACQVAGKKTARSHKGEKKETPIVLDSDESSEVILIRRKPAMTKSRRILVVDSSEDEDEDVQSSAVNILCDLPARPPPTSASNQPISPALYPSPCPPLTPPRYNKEADADARDQQSKATKKRSTDTRKKALNAASNDYLTQLSAIMATLPPHIVTSVALSGNLEPALPHLTPRTRTRLMALLPNKKAPAAPIQDLQDLTEDLSVLSLTPSRPSGTESNIEIIDASIEDIEVSDFAAVTPTQTTAHPAILRLLSHTEQTEVLDFHTFLQAFPFDEVHGNRAGNSSFKKIGEASFSEVFALGQVVIKTVPLVLEDSLPSEIELPCASQVDDVEKEILITKEMGEAHSGFIKLLKVFVVTGSYPAALLDLWDRYDELKGSENVRPHVLPPSTHYALIILPHGGTDLESFTFSPKSEWKESVSVFWQVTRALAVAEESHQFEHRDLHWGQILIKEDPTQSSGVSAVIIDFGLSRMEATDGRTYHTELDNTIFEGHGDYQFDIYRMMKAHNNSNWSTFKPYTNVLWLHYLAMKLLKGKGLRRPTAPKTTARTRQTQTAAQMEREIERSWYDTLVEIEKHLSRALKQPTKAKGSRRQAVDDEELPPTSAGDVMLWMINRSQ